MDKRFTYRLIFIWLVVLFLVTCFVNLKFGSIPTSLKAFLQALFTNTAADHSLVYIIWNYRLPKMLTAILIGAGLSTSGLLMQTLFRNPLAGPFVLGISSGASLGVALLIMGSSFLSTFIPIGILNSYSTTLAASTGSVLVIIAILRTLKKIKNTLSILIIGLMFGSISGAIINVLSFFSNANELQQFIFWSFGDIGNLTWEDIVILSSIVIGGLLAAVFCIKPLNALLLGENYATSMGINTKKSTMYILVIASLITGVITAFAGPIAFVGIAVPHISKLVFKTSDHHILLPGVALTGAILMLFCDTIAQLPNSELTLPINAITALFGAPIVIWLLLKKQKVHY